MTNPLPFQVFSQAVKSQDVQVTNCDFSELYMLPFGITVTGKTFSKCSFTRATFTGITFKSCQFDACDFSYADFSGGQFISCEFTSSKGTQVSVDDDTRLENITCNRLTGDILDLHGFSSNGSDSIAFLGDSPPAFCMGSGHFDRYFIGKDEGETYLEAYRDLFAHIVEGFAHHKPVKGVNLIYAMVAIGVITGNFNFIKNHKENTPRLLSEIVAEMFAKFPKDYLQRIPHIQMAGSILPTKKKGKKENTVELPPSVLAKFTPKKQLPFLPISQKIAYPEQASPVLMNLYNVIFKQMLKTADAKHGKPYTVAKRLSKYNRELLSTKGFMELNIPNLFVYICGKTDVLFIGPTFAYMYRDYEDQGKNRVEVECIYDLSNHTLTQVRENLSAHALHELQPFYDAMSLRKPIIQYE